MLFDTHAHLHDEAFQKDRAAALARALEAGVEAICEVGIDLLSSKKAVALAAAPPVPGPKIYAAIGIHPHDADRMREGAIEELRRLAGSPGVVAIGETGLDFYRNKSSREGQERAFRAQLELACDLGLPLILHLRSSAQAGDGALDAYRACLRVLDDYRGAARGVSHCFSGTPEIAQALAERGFYVSFAGNATYPNAAVLREAARAAPLDRILVETDCPYLAPQAHRGKRNEPAFVRETADEIARARGVAFEEIAAATAANARRLFGLDCA
jgi:TatD DNase family protein